MDLLLLGHHRRGISYSLDAHQVREWSSQESLKKHSFSQTATLAKPVTKKTVPSN